MGAVLFPGAGWSQKRLPDIPGIRTGPGQLGTGMGAHCLVGGIASHGSGSPSRCQLATMEAPRHPKHPSFTQCDGCLGWFGVGTNGCVAGITSHGSSSLSRAGWLQWRPSDIPGTHLPYIVMQLLKPVFI